MLLRKKAGKKLYKKAPVKFLLESAKRLQKMAMLSFVLALMFVFLSNPFKNYTILKSLPENIAAVRTNAKQIIASVPEFIKVLPQETEKSSFAFFDWTKEQLTQINYSWPVFAKEKVPNDKEAGQSATKIDYALLPFYIEIPKLNVYEKVISNVNPNNEKEYESALKEGVAHALGSAFPGQNEMVYIFGHSTNGAWNVEAYNAIFYQIKDLESGDEVILHLGDQDFKYIVDSQEVITNSDVDYINNLKSENILLLQTCWPPGTSWQRLFVIAKPAIQ